MARPRRPQGIRPGIATQEGGLPPRPASPAPTRDVSPENSPGHPANRPTTRPTTTTTTTTDRDTEDTGRSGGTTDRGTGDTERSGGGGIDGIPNSDLSGLADGEYKIDGYDVYVSTTNTGYRTVRVPFHDSHGRSDGTRFLLRTTRPDGSIFDQTWDFEKSKPVSNERSYSNEDIAGGRVPNIGGPGVGHGDPGKRWLHVRTGHQSFRGAVESEGRISR